MGFCCCGSKKEKFSAPPTSVPASALPPASPYVPRPPPPLGARPAAAAHPPAAPRQMALSDEQILFFADHGYLHLRGVVPPHEVAAALSVIDTAYAAGRYVQDTQNPTNVVPDFKPSLAREKALIAPLAGTPLYNMVEQLIGRGCAWQPQQAQVALREPCERMRREGVGHRDPPDPNGWHIDGGNGKYKHLGTPFSMLVGICLSHGQDEDANNGQLLVWPGSHRALHAGVAQQVAEGRITHGYSIFAGTREERPDIGAPVRVLMRPGDAVIAHQRLGHAGGPNVGPYVRKNLYMRVMNQKHEKFLLSGELVNGSVFTEYHGVQDVLRKYGRPE